MSVRAHTLSHLVGEAAPGATRVGLRAASIAGIGVLGELARLPASRIQAPAHRLKRFLWATSFLTASVFSGVQL